MPISPSLFRRAYNRFQQIHIEASGWPLDSFSNRQSFAYGWEGYKNAIPDRAMAIMEPRRWTRATIGTGEILSRVIRAIELPGNNLLQWEGRQGPNSRVHLRLIDAQAEPAARRELETLLFELYKNGSASQQVFESMTAHCGKRYELLGYLFFIAAPDRFLPLRTRSFDKAFAELGVDLRTEGNCSWDNYSRFIAAVRDVQRCLQAEGFRDATLLDAHSFCWILARHKAGESESKAIAPASLQPFDGTLHRAAQSVRFTPKDDAEVRDMREEAQKRQASGQIAEEIALQAEKERLCKAGQSDLAGRVENVADRPGLGYDIKSFESDGSERFIEVKNITNGNRFFLSEGEWLNSRARQNYWFYLVSGVDTKRPRVTCLPAKDLKRSHLQPVQYLVRFDS